MPLSITPGPWEVQSGPQSCFHSDNRHAITHSGMDGNEPWTITIAEVWPSTDGTDLADARAIAALPDLIAFVQELAEWESGAPTPNMADISVRARSALRQAGAL